ncbi:hypothetical protein BRC81_07875 [Halobacteriales archaeon QS_1_68_20]|nr:MAG: hypothetical protein BRC81_07875 [Halobacteriales archaeon QS_1_68_20]
MRKSVSPTRVLAVLAMLVALTMVATPAAASPGAESALETVFSSMGPPDGVGPECAWWIPWCF